MRRSLVTSALLAIACGDEQPDVDWDAPPAHSEDGLTLEWSMERVGDELQISYAVINQRATGVWLFDQILGDGQPERETVLIQNDPAANTVVFIRGYFDLPPGVKPVAPPTTPVARRLEPGATIRATARTRLPLRAYSNIYQSRPLDLINTHAVLAVGYSDAGDDVVETLPTTPPLKVALWPPAQKLLRSPAHPLPPDATLWLPVPPRPFWEYARRVFPRPVPP